MSSLLLTNLTADTGVSAGGNLPLGSAVHGFGRCISLNGNSIQLNGPGYYEITAEVSMAVTGAAEVTMQLYSNGVAVPGAIAAETPSAAGATVNLSLPWVVRRGCCCEPVTLTFVISQAGTIYNSIVVVDKK